MKQFESALRWVCLRLEFIGSFVILFASLVAVFKKDSISGGVAGLSISYAITVNHFYTFEINGSI